jgi:hypothetical protein
MKPVLEHRTYDIYSTQLLDILIDSPLAYTDYLLNLGSKDGTAMNRTPYGDLSGLYIFPSQEAVPYAKRRLGRRLLQQDLSRYLNLVSRMHATKKAPNSRARKTYQQYRHRYPPIIVSTVLVD